MTLPQRHPRRPDRRLLRLGMATAIALAVGIALWTLDPSPSRNTRLVLADGSQLTVGQVTINTQDTYHDGSWLAHLAQQIHLPAGWRRGPLRSYSISAAAKDTTNLLIWLVLQPAPGTTAPRFAFKLSADDESNSPLIQPTATQRPAVELKVPSHSPGPSPSSSSGASIIVLDHTLPAALSPNTSAILLRESVWPRHARVFRLEVYEYASPDNDAPGPRLAGSLRVPNPQPVQRAPWTPTPASALATTGDSSHRSSTSIRLRRFEIRPMPRLLSPLPGPEAIEPRAFLEFQIEPSTADASSPRSPSPRPTLGWSLAEIALRDPLGNSRVWRPPHPRQGSPMDPSPSIRADNLPLPWPNESVYAVETLWLPPGPPLEAERISVPNVVLSPQLRPPGLVGGGRHPSGTFELYASRGRSTPDPGWILRVFPRTGPGQVSAQAGPGAPSQSPGANGTAGIKELKILDAPSPRHALILLEAHDQHGRRWPAHEPDELELPEDAGTVTVILAARPLVPLRFVSPPERRPSSLPARRPTP